MLAEPQRQADTPAGRKLRQMAEPFMGNRTPTRADIEQWAEEYNKRAVTSITDLLAAGPRVVTQRQLSRLTIGVVIALAIAHSRGKRACVWQAQHTGPDGGRLPEDLQVSLRRSVSPEKFEKIGPAFVFFEVRRPCLCSSH